MTVCCPGCLHHVRVGANQLAICNWCNRVWHVKPKRKPLLARFLVFSLIMFVVAGLVWQSL